MEQIFVWTPRDVIALVIVTIMALVVVFLYLGLMITNTIRWFKKKVSSPKIEDIPVQYTSSKEIYKPTVTEKPKPKFVKSDEQRYKDALGF